MKHVLEADLAWFFGRAAAEFERSPEGARLERAEQFGFDSSGERIESPGEHESRVWDSRQRRCKRSAATMAQSVADELREFLLGEQNADGSLDAQNTGRSGAEQAGYVPDHATLTRYARISRSLSCCTGAQRAALAAYHGETGARWERSGVRPGRILTVMVQTDAGARVLAARWMRLKQHDQGSANDRMAAELQLQVTAANKERGRLLHAAEHQARSLLAAAHARFEEFR